MTRSDMPPGMVAVAIHARFAGRNRRFRRRWFRLAPPHIADPVTRTFATPFAWFTEPHRLMRRNYRR